LDFQIDSTTAFLGLSKERPARYPMQLALSYWNNESLKSSSLLESKVQKYIPTTMQGAPGQRPADVQRTEWRSKFRQALSDHLSTRLQKDCPDLADEMTRNQGNSD
jgi:hypothetical protein